MKETEEFKLDSVVLKHPEDLHKCQESLRKLNGLLHIMGVEFELSTLDNSIFLRVIYDEDKLYCNSERKGKSYRKRIYSDSMTYGDIKDMKRNQNILFKDIAEQLGMPSATFNRRLKKFRDYEKEHGEGSADYMRI